MNWSHFQTDIFRAGLETEESLLIEAVAGSGKSSTLEELFIRMWATKPHLRYKFVAFSKDIAEAMNARLKRRGLPEISSTLHSVCWQAWKRSLGWDENLCKVDTNKTFGIMKEMMTWKEREKWGETTRRLVGYGKQVGIVPKCFHGPVPGLAPYRGLVEDTDRAWESLCDHYGIDFDEVPLGLVRKVLARGIEVSRESCDFDDMLMMPIIAGVEFDKYDIVFVDETQDLSTIQMEMISRMVKRRVIAVGDRAQSIYQWRGAHSASMDELRDRFHMRELPLSISYRCPRAVVLKAKTWVPQIESHEAAIAGFVGEEGTDWKGQAKVAMGAPIENRRGHENDDYSDSCCGADSEQCGAGHASSRSSESSKEVWLEEGISKWQGLNDFAAGDVILCRLTRPLVAAAFALIRARIPARVLGRDIGRGLTKLVDRVIKKARAGPQMLLPAFAGALDEYLDSESRKMASKGKRAEIGKLEDRVATIRVFVDEGINGNNHQRGDASAVDCNSPETVADLTREIERLFSDNGHTGVTLSTIHKAKGLEWDRVFILDASSLMPWKWATQDWELAQERNLMYVACTRSRRELRYITSEELGIGGEF